jgi:hypothetical protein
MPTARVPIRPAAFVILTFLAAASTVPAAEPVQAGGVYPHLAVFNDGGGECGIGAVVPWAGRLWLITYPPHATQGSKDKLYEIDERLGLAIRPESVGGTHACRMIHRESNQLIIGPYFIDARRQVRAADIRQLKGRMTAVARHLTDPANKVYFFDREGAIYEVDVHALAVTRLFEKPVPGAHGKGGYTSQGRLVIANNGAGGAAKGPFEDVAEGPAGPENAGVLAEWDGKAWRIVRRRQFTDVTGPGGILGAPAPDSPLWAVGWDRRSVILMLLDGGRWHGVGAARDKGEEGRETGGHGVTSWGTTWSTRRRSGGRYSRSALRIEAASVARYRARSRASAPGSPRKWL